MQAAGNLAQTPGDMLRVLLALVHWDTGQWGAPRLTDILADARAVVAAEMAALDDADGG